MYFYLSQCFSLLLGDLLIKHYAQEEKTIPSKISSKFIPSELVTMELYERQN